MHAKMITRKAVASNSYRGPPYLFIQDFNFYRGALEIWLQASQVGVIRGQEVIETTPECLQGVRDICEIISVLLAA